MQKTPNQEIVGQRLGAVICSSFRRRYVPLDGSVLYTLFPDTVKNRGVISVVMRLGMVRMFVDSDGKVSGKCIRWWDVDVLHRKWLDDPGSVPAQAVTARNMLIQAMERNYVSPFGADLPLYLNLATSRNRAYDWNMLEWDVFRGLNSQVPFDYKLSRSTKGKITSELPFIDMKEHFRSVVPESMCMQLIRQLIDQHTRAISSMALMPLRWFDRVEKNDVVVAETGVPLVIDITDARRSKIEAGAIKVDMTREPRRRRRRRDKNHVR